MIEKLCSCLLIIAFIIPCVFILLNSAEYVDNFNKVSLPFNDFADKIAVSALSEVEKLGELAPALLYTISPSQQDGIFITDQYLLEDVVDEDQNWRQNSLAIKEFAENVDIPVYYTIIPTAIAIKQQELPATAKIYNQKKMIEEAYKLAGGNVRSIDCYSELFSVRDQYIYYRTEPMMTSLGGYYVYHSIVKSMREKPLAISDFSVFHREKSVYGSLYGRIKIKNFPKDIVSLYEYNESRAVSVTHFGNDGIRKYSTLYPEFLKRNPYQCSLGGFSPRIEIESLGGRFNSVLVIGDKNSIGILPFLALDFEKVTFLNLSDISVEELLNISEKDYDKAIFCYSAHSILNEIGLDKSAVIGIDKK